MQILVTGASGFIGSFIVEKAINNYNVTMNGNISGRFYAQTLSELNLDNVNFSGYSAYFGATTNTSVKTCNIYNKVTPNAECFRSYNCDYNMRGTNPATFKVYAYEASLYNYSNNQKQKSKVTFYTSGAWNYGGNDTSISAEYFGADTDDAAYGIFLDQNCTKPYNDAEASATNSSWSRSNYVYAKSLTFEEVAEVSDVDYVVVNDALPTVTVTNKRTGEPLDTSLYELSYSVEDTSTAGVATVTVIGKGKFEGSNIVKKFVILPKAMTAEITNRRKAGNNAKATLSGEWYLPKNATNIKAGIARLSTDDTNVTKYDVYNNGVKKASALKTTSGKYSFSLLMNSTHANQNLYAVTYVTYEIDGVPFVSLSKAFTSYPNPV